jgi:glycosyltransferase involved in cell wall biosynthesis
VPRAAARAKADLLHEPHYVLPPLTRCRTVVTIHDCIHLRFPEYLPSRAAFAYAHTMIRLAARKADRVLTVSDASKRDILHYTGVAPEKVVVVYNGLDARFAAAPDAEAMDRVRSASSSIIRSCSTSATSSRTRTSSGSSLPSRRCARRSRGLKLVVIGDETSKHPALRQPCTGTASTNTCGSAQPAMTLGPSPRAGVRVPSL